MNSLIAACLLTLLSMAQCCLADSPEKPWVSLSDDGTLSYRTTAAGDRVMDFSYAGYHAGGVAIPSPPTVMTVTPRGTGDDALAIQKAIDQVSARPLTNGFRGAVLLGPGTFRCESSITLKASGVVLRGSGSGKDGTTLLLRGQPHTAIVIDGPSTTNPGVIGSPVRVTDQYVPSGAISLDVVDAGAFAVNDTVHVVKSVTPEWVEFMGMDTLVRDGKPQTWVRGGIRMERTISRIAGNRLTFDVPLPDSLDAKFLGPTGATVVKVPKPDRLSEIGIESLRIVSPPQKVKLLDPQFRAISAEAVADAWIRDLFIEETVNSVSLGRNTRRITVQQVTINHTTKIVGAAKPIDIGCDGSQILIDRCSGSGDELFFIATGSKVYGPNVALHCTYQGSGRIQPHHRWATGFLVDNCDVSDGGIDFMNRGAFGTGHGWTIGWAVAWNCSAKSFVIQQPPGACNWAIGCKGKQVKSPMPNPAGTPAERRTLPQGYIESHGVPVEPASLYLAQLNARLGPSAAKNTEYSR
jgi:hypothetical protein